MLGLAVIVFTQIACGGVTITTMSTDEVLQKMLEGHEAYVFGNDEFVSNTIEDLTQYGMMPKEVKDLHEAIELSKRAFVELHCDRGDQDFVAQAESAEYLLQRKDIDFCVVGVLFLDVKITDYPDLYLGDSEPVDNINLSSG